MEDYIDGMVIKSKQIGGHLADLGEVFSVLREYKLHLNASKCSFGISTGRFLGYILTHQGLRSTPIRLRLLTICTLLGIPKKYIN